MSSIANPNCVDWNKLHSETFGDALFRYLSIYPEDIPLFESVRKAKNLDIPPLFSSLLPTFKQKNFFCSIILRILLNVLHNILHIPPTLNEITNRINRRQEFIS